MKRNVCFALLTLITFTGFAQERILNNVALAPKSGDTIGLPVLSTAFISLRDGTQDFKAEIALFPIIPDPDKEDSLEQENKPLILKLQGKFPVSNIDFLGTADNGKTYTMNVTASVNDSTQDIVLNFALVILKEEPVNPNGNIQRYLPKMSFELLLESKYFGLNTSPFNMPDVILIRSTAAVISKTD